MTEGKIDRGDAYEQSGDLGIGRMSGGEIKKGAMVAGVIVVHNYHYSEATEIAPIESAEAAPDEDLLCPYRSLFHFSPNDAEFFFGREVFVDQLFQVAQTRNFIPVLGASGSGKSSVVLAGLVPRLQREGRWLFTHFRPGADPFYALALALVPLYRSQLDSTDRIIQARKLAQSWSQGELPLSDVLAQIQRQYPTERLLLIADLFEELYTPSVEPASRRRFLDCLLASISSSGSQSRSSTVLVATMRADFLSNALSYRPFADVLQNGDIKIAVMNRDELSDAIVKPAEALGVNFEPGLAERILAAIENEPGNLPLLEFALTELWRQRSGKQLTHEAYEAIGEVQGAKLQKRSCNRRIY